MATYTDNYQLTKPTYAEQADIGVINSNMNIIDDVMHSSQISLAPAYDQSQTYAEGDVVMYELLMYKCISPTTGVWDASKWERTTASESGGGGSAELDILGEASGAVASFADGASAELAKCIVEIVPKQAGSGTPSPDNVRTISGSTSVTVTISDGETSTTKTTPLGQTVYGGVLNILTGELIITHRRIALSDYIWTYDANPTHERFSTGVQTGFKIPATVDDKADLICEILENVSNMDSFTHTVNNSISFGNTGRFYLYIAGVTTNTDLAPIIANRYAVIELATPITVQLTPQEVNSLLGQNNISADTGDVDIVYVKASAPIQPNPTGTPTATLKKLGIEGTVFAVEGGGGGSSSGINYSTTEQVVGTWIDGKPLYQRTFDLTAVQLTDNDWNNNILGTIGIRIKHYEGLFSIGQTEPIVPYEYIRSSTQYFTSTLNDDASDVNVRPNMNTGTLYAGIVTIQYTKITD